jgi:hypothetical protein
MNCCPGDMAIVVGGRNIGLVVEVICPSQTYGPPYWCVTTSRSVMGINPDHSVIWTRQGSIHDARLRPIRPGAPGCAAVVPREVEATAEVT